MKTIITIAAVGAALLAGTPAFAGYNNHHNHHNAHITFKTTHHSHHNTYRTYTPTYTYQHTYKPVYVPTYKEPTVEIKKVEICWAIKKDHYGHVFKYQVACPIEKVVVKQETTVEKPAETTEAPVEQK